jgi:hypothetical protein
MDTVTWPQVALAAINALYWLGILAFLAWTFRKQ